MMMSTRRILLNFMLAAAASGCGAAVDGSEESDAVGEVELGLLGGNAMSPNAMSPNAMSPNALAPSALSATALSPAALSPAALQAILDPGSAGALSRELLRYAVGCAFDQTQTFSFTWIDEGLNLHHETYSGLLGIATAWAKGPLDLKGQELVSACLAARTNWYGAPVVISMRSSHDPLKTMVQSPEIAAYPDVEGGFWGNLFAASPYARACYSQSTVSNSRSHLRDCAAGHLNPDQTISTCGMIDIVGACETMCTGLNGGGQYYPDCTDPVYGSISRMVTTALP